MKVRDGKPAQDRPKNHRKPGGGRKVNILIVDDHPLMRAGLSALVESQAEFTVCAQAGTAADALNLLNELRPDAVIVDLSLPGTGGLELIRDLRARIPDLPVLVVSMHDERLYAERALRAGARGYVMKQDPPERVTTGLRTILEGKLFVSPEVASSLLDAHVFGARNKGKTLGMDLLSDREMQVFEGIGRGATTRQLAERLHLSPKTIETYRLSIKRKLALPNGNGLVHAAVHWVMENNT